MARKRNLYQSVNKFQVLERPKIVEIESNRKFNLQLWIIVLIIEDGTILIKIISSPR